MEGTIAQILFFAGNFAPKNWAFCNGQLMSIASNTALFSLLGTQYGGDGRTTFALPDFRGRVPVGVGQGPGLSPVVIGEKSGTETSTMLLTQMPSHSHTTTVSMGVAGSNADNDSPVGNVFAVPSSDSFGTVANASAAGTSLSLNPAGGNQPFSIMQPYLAVNYVICMFGVYPARN